MTTERAIKVDAQLRERIKDAAWERRTTASDIVGRLVASVASATYPTPRETRLVTLKFYGVDEDVWVKARDNAHAAGLSMAEAVELELANLKPVER